MTTTTSSQVQSEPFHYPFLGQIKAGERVCERENLRAGTICIVRGGCTVATAAERGERGPLSPFENPRSIIPFKVTVEWDDGTESVHPPYALCYEQDVLDNCASTIARTREFRDSLPDDSKMIPAVNRVLAYYETCPQL